MPARKRSTPKKSAPTIPEIKSVFEAKAEALKAKNHLDYAISVLEDAVEETPPFRLDDPSEEEGETVFRILANTEEFASSREWISYRLAKSFNSIDLNEFEARCLRDALNSIFPK